MARTIWIWLSESFQTVAWTSS